MNQENLWFSVKADEFGGHVIGSIYGNNDNVVNRFISYNANDLPDIKGKYGFRVVFRVSSVEGPDAKAAVNSLILNREQVLKLVRHNTSKIEVVVKSEVEGKNYALKALAIINKTENRYKKAVRKELEENLLDEINKKPLKDLIGEIVTEKLQHSLQKKLTKIYPTRTVEIRALEPL